MQSGCVPVVMTTHRASEASIKRSIKEIDKLSVIKDKTMVIRMENKYAS